MKLYYDRRAKDPTYYIQQGFRNGKKTTTRNVLKIGKHSELLAITDDPLEYAKLKVAEYNEQYKNGLVSLSYSVDFNEKLVFSDSVASKSTCVNIGYLILQKIYHDLGISSFFDSLDHKASFDCNEINRFLTFGRILDPMSKLGTFDHTDSYFEKPKFEYQHILRFMDILEKNYNDYITALFNGSKNVTDRNTQLMYFDCTNYYFEIEQEDEDYIDEVTGELIRGLRKYGKSKENRPNPIVQMGLFIDQRGIPVSMCIHHGSNNEQNTAVPLESVMIRDMGIKDFIYCADAGLGSTSIRKFNDMGGRKFIVTQSIKKMTDILQESVFEDIDYRLLSDDREITLEEMKNFDRKDPLNRSLYDDHAYKVLEKEDLTDLGLSELKIFENGSVKRVKSKGKMKQRIIITFSRKMMEYQRSVRNRQIERAKKIIAAGNCEDLKKGNHDVKRFIRNTSKGKNQYELDTDRIEKEERYDGFYAVATNLDDSVKDILEVNSKRYRIEDCFRVMKTNFDARPVYHRNPERIKAHFMICYTALLIYRLLEIKLDDYGTHFTADNIIETLKNMNVTNVQDMYYQSCYTASEVCTALNGIYNLGLDKKYYQTGRLKKLANSLKK